MVDGNLEESEGTISSGSAGAEPIVDLTRITKIQTYEVQEMELEKLDSLVTTENTNVAFTTFTAGVSVATFVSWLAAEKLSPSALAIHWAIIIPTGILAVFFCIAWIRARRERPRLLGIVRGRSGLTRASIK